MKLRQSINVLKNGLILLTLIFPILNANGFYPTSRSDQNNGFSLNSPNILFEDNFNDGNADGWVEYGLGTWYVTNGEYHVDMGIGLNLGGQSLAGNNNWTNYIYELDVMSEDGGDQGILFRCVSVVPDCYYVNLQGSGLNHVLLGKPDLPYVLASADFPIIMGAWYHVKIALIGSNIKVFVNNSLVINYTASAPYLVTHGGIGLSAYTGAYNSDKVRFDNIIVTVPYTWYFPMVIN